EISKKGGSKDCWFGRNNQSWSLAFIGLDRYSVHHNNREKLSHRVGVYVDCPVSTLSFYRVSDTLTHIHTFNNTFTHTLYPGFGIWSGSSVTL
ncbi:hypothetical protein LDENG_00242810, partial [Lucifuga dentata]